MAERGVGTRVSREVRGGQPGGASEGGGLFQREAGHGPSLPRVGGRLPAEGVRHGVQPQCLPRGQGGGRVGGGGRRFPGECFRAGTPVGAESIGHGERVHGGGVGPDGERLSLYRVEGQGSGVRQRVVGVHHGEGGTLVRRQRLFPERGPEGGAFLWRHETLRRHRGPAVLPGEGFRCPLPRERADDYRG